MKLAAAAVAVLVAAAFMFSLSWAEPAPEATVCPYCRAQRSADEFCAHCGRLVGTATTGAANRFWGDVPYVLQFVPTDVDPVIAAEISDAGIARETVTLRTGDRYTWTPGPQGPVVEGRVNFGRTAKESRLHVTISDTVEGDRLVAREILGEIASKPNAYLHRKLDYVYTADGLLESVKFGTWLYDDASDWKKRPGEWSRHAIGEIAFIREEGRLTRVETTVREGRRSLRGEPEYAEPKVIVETVKRAATGAIDRLVKTTK